MTTHAAPSRDAPTSSTDLEAGRNLSIGEFTHDPTLNLSEARIILDKSLEARKKRLLEQNPNATEHERNNAIKDTDTLFKTREYLDLFAVFKQMQDAEDAERVINSYAGGMERFERSQLGSLVPSCADEAKALIPSLERKVEVGEVNEEDLDGLCKELTRIKKHTRLGG
ncbi:RNA polymerase B [Knufia fluminis]|uniref:RNA polymerase B n=1 Tax=Knufia fluminis TaxID=191047 RepID=A0AAN8IHQ2_9EURO|nr:RNA polymerase B [Knufia fluminis]